MRVLRFASVLLLWLAAALQGVADQKPNIVVIIADDLVTVILDIWAVKMFQHQTRPPCDEGVRFTSGYVSGPYCSRLVLVT